MNGKLTCIMLVDDNPDDNFFHERVIRKIIPAIEIIIMLSGVQALEYIKSKTKPHADLIFLDINMPGKNGWEMLKAYNQLDKELQSHSIVMMLTTSQNPDDAARADVSGNVCEYISKPLTSLLLKDIIEKYFYA